MSEGERGVKRTVEYAAALALLKSFGWIPRFAAYPAAEIVAALGFRLAGRQRRAGTRNLKMAMPHLDDRERRAILRGSFSSLGRLLVEFSHFPDLHKGNISDHVVYEGFEHYENAVKRGQGVLFLTGHFGAWELSCFAHSLYGHPMKFIVRQIDNARVERLIGSYRGRAGNTPIEKRNASRDILRALRNNETIGILVDQNTTRDEGVFVNFFGIPAATTPAIATLALRTGAAVVPGFLIWDRKIRKHRLHFDPPMEMISTGDPARDILENTQACNDVLERMKNSAGSGPCCCHHALLVGYLGSPSLAVSGL
jgi:KDO2-lipid IV(A) lauroyltransferase